MKSTEQMKNEMVKRLQNLEARREHLERQAAGIDRRLGEVRQEIGRLGGAIRALDGQTPEQMVDTLTKLSTQADPAAFQAPIPSLRVNKWEHSNEDLDADMPSEQPPAPQGFHWGKNSFGEEALIPDGVELPPMEEPVVPLKPFNPAGIPCSDEFDDPKNLY